MTRPAHPWPGAVLFDLDGTLVDSVPDLAGAVNVLLSRRGLDPLDLAAVRGMVGNGIEKLLERAFAHRGSALAGGAFDAAYAEMLDVYGGCLADRTTPMPGAMLALARLRDAGVRMGVATNKAQAATDAILRHFAIAPFLGASVGGDAGHARKPAGDILLAAAGRLGVAPADTVMVGDSAADVGAARAAGMPVVVVRGGYTTVPVELLGADLVMDGLDALFDALPRLAPARA